MPLRRDDASSLIREEAAYTGAGDELFKACHALAFSHGPAAGEKTLSKALHWQNPNMTDGRDLYPERIEATIRRLLSGGREAGLRELAPIAYPVREITPRPGLSRSTIAGILVRDGFLCRYCGVRTIPTPILQLLSSVYPDEFPYHPNWKSGVTHPAVMSRSAAVDHVLPGSRGGSWTDPTNLVTSCWPCNVRKADLTIEEAGWTLRPITPSGWDGLTDLYEGLWRAAGAPQGSHPAWIRAFTQARTRPRGTPG